MLIAWKGGPCANPECPRGATLRGFCAYHYQVWRQSPDFVRFVPRVRQPCAVDGCENLAKAGALCNTHYQRARRATDPTRVGPCLPGRMVHAYSHSGKCVHCGAARSRPFVKDPRVGWHKAKTVDPSAATR